MLNSLIFALLLASDSSIDCRWLGFLAEQSVLLIQENPEIIINVMTEEEQKVVDEAKMWHGSAPEFRKKIILECKEIRI